METELMEYQKNNHVPLTKEELLTQVRTIQTVMHTVMKRGEHYGVVPGCGDKPTLLKPGAEKLMHTFHLAPDPEILSLFPGDEDKVGYRVICRINSIHTGRFMGSGVGECSSEETKYKWRNAVCEEEFEETDDTHRRKKYFPTGKFAKQVRQNPHDLANTILKMAKKRALVDAILTVCAASDIFTQDLDEMGEVIQGSTTKPSESESNPIDRVTPNEWHIAHLTNFVIKTGKTGNKEWKRRIMTFTLVNGTEFEIGCLHLPEGWDDEILEEYANSDNLLAFKWSKNNRGYKELSGLANARKEDESEEKEPA